MTAFMRILVAVISLSAWAFPAGGDHTKPAENIIAVCSELSVPDSNVLFKDSHSIMHARVSARKRSCTGMITCGTSRIYTKEHRQHTRPAPLKTASCKTGARETIFLYCSILS